jgi:hypothetical protein
MSGWKVAALAIIVATPAAAGSISDPICTDRPGHNSATCAAPKGHWQVETSLADWSVTKAGGVRASDLSIGATAIKYGVAPGLHLEVAIEPYVRHHEREATGSTTVTGFGDVAIKAKREISTSSENIGMALYPFVKLPTASKRIGNGKVEGGLVIPLSLAIANTPLSLATSPELDLVADADGRGYHWGMAHALALGWSVTERLSLAGEVWGAWDWDDGATTRQATIGGNSAFKLSDNAQIDAQVDFGLARDTPDVALSGGVSLRF